MKTLNLFVLLVAWAVIGSSCTSKSGYDWKLGAQSYTFHRFSFVETLDKLQSLGLNYVEVYYGQRLGQGFGDQTMDYKMDKEVQKKVLELSKSKNVKIIASGVVICNDEAEWTQLFEFAGSMGIEIITCEPNPEHMDIVEKLAEQHKIDVAIHNHPQPSHYWSPDLLMKALEGRSKRMGVCADVGHWKREGIDPVKALQQVGNRLKSLHFKDIKAPEEGEAEQHDVIWGTGICNVADMLEVLKNNKFKGLMSIEYEYNWDNSVPDIRKCIQYLDEQTK
ncbi:MAG: sugar phosphate isomerase/epimerase [Bacteroidales bacterium]|jgi:sugar phosphate isomerase/epimerase|nr:sugar phosphate isomerase/epimerase [Bacteroidales bacterium]